MTLADIYKCAECGGRCFYRNDEDYPYYQCDKCKKTAYIKKKNVVIMFSQTILEPYPDNYAEGIKIVTTNETS